jgi:hypothetical protein
VRLALFYVAAAVPMTIGIATTSWKEKPEDSSLGYMHIDNLYKNQTVLLFKEGYALEKIHGTSAHITYRAAANPEVTFFSGGAKHADFVSLFDAEGLKQRFEELGLDDVTIYGEAFGGKMQGMSKSYGIKLRFIAFDVMVGRGEQGVWLNVPNACDVVTKWA